MLMVSCEGFLLIGLVALLHTCEEERGSERALVVLTKASSKVSWTYHSLQSGFTSIFDDNVEYTSRFFDLSVSDDVGRTSFGRSIWLKMA